MFMFVVIRFLLSLCIPLLKWAGYMILVFAIWIIGMSLWMDLQGETAKKTTTQHVSP